MLIFIKAKYLPLIQSGAKTTTIRPWRKCKLRPGHVLSINGRLRVELLRVTLCTLATLTDDDARADGFSSRAAFLRAYRSHYPTSTPTSPCCVLTFASPRP